MRIIKRKRSKSTDFDLVIGITGLKAGGKDEMARFLGQELGFTVRSCGDEIRDQLRRDGVEATIERQVELGNRGRLESGDIGYWAKRVLATCKGAGNRLVAVNGLRHPDEVTGLGEIAGSAFVMAGVVAPIGLRAQRLIGRGRAGDPKTIEDFLRLDDTDRGIGQPPHGQQVDRTLARVPWENVCDNRGTLEGFHDWIRAFVARVLKERGFAK